MEWYTVLKKKWLLLYEVAIWVVPHIRANERNQAQMDYTVYAIQEEGKFTGNDRSQIFFFAVK